jgi:hypothetical protein
MSLREGFLGKRKVICNAFIFSHRRLQEYKSHFEKGVQKRLDLEWKGYKQKSQHWPRYS